VGIVVCVCSKFHMLSSSAKILQIGEDLTKLQSSKVGIFLRHSVVVERNLQLNSVVKKTVTVRLENVYTPKRNSGMSLTHVG